MKAFLDSSLVLDLLEGSARGDRFATSIASFGRRWCASPLVRMERLVRPLRVGDDAISRTQEFFTPMTMLPMIDETFDLAARLRAKRGLKALDALHVATALVHGCGERGTADARRARAEVEGLAFRLIE